MTKKRPFILVIDDDPDILEAIRMVFECYSYGVETSSSDQEAMRKIRRTPPDLIVLDYLLSGTTGAEVCAKLKASAHTKNIPIIMISAHPDALQASQKVGAEDFMPKPFEVEALLRKIDFHLAH